MAGIKFGDGPGGRLIKSQSDATKVEKQLPVMGNPAFPPGVMLNPVEVVAQANKPKGKINYWDIFDADSYTYGPINFLKGANTLLGGNVAKNGHERETYSDVISRLEQTPGTIQNKIKNIAPLVQPVPSPFAGMSNLAISTVPYTNRTSAATGDIVFDPINHIPFGRWAKGGLGILSGYASKIPKLADRLRFLGNTAPWVDRGKDVAEGGNSYLEYENKPRYNQELSPQQREFLKRISQYNFSNMK